MPHCKTIGCYNLVENPVTDDYCNECMNRQIQRNHQSHVRFLTSYTAADCLANARSHQESRAKEYEQEGGERSMEKIVGMFNILKGTSLTEKDGWDFMELLKMVRCEHTAFHQDSFEDRVSYASLAAEAAFRHTQHKEIA